jgi:hypothetical protein
VPWGVDSGQALDWAISRRLVANQVNTQPLSVWGAMKKARLFSMVNLA